MVPILSFLKNEKRLIIEPNTVQMAKKGAEIFSQAAKKSVETRGRFSVAISGGSTPRDMHRLLGEEPFLSDIPWHGIEIFWVDERCVPVNNKNSNYGTASKDFLDRVPIPLSQIHPMPGEGSPEEGAFNYQQELRRLFKTGAGEFPRFDLIFLGLGTDGHTASLFPGQGSLDEKERLVVPVKGGHPELSRLTMTYPVLNSGKQIVFMVSGRKKAEVVKTVLEDKQRRFPAHGIQPAKGNLIFLIEREAASLLSGEDGSGESLG
jgi:6-phosphogluconolactonase